MRAQHAAATTSRRSAPASTQPAPNNCAASASPKNHGPARRQAATSPSAVDSPAGQRGAAAKSLNVNTVQGKVTHGKPHEDHGTRGRPRPTTSNLPRREGGQRENLRGRRQSARAQRADGVQRHAVRTARRAGQDVHHRRDGPPRLGAGGRRPPDGAALYEEIALDAQFSYSVEMQFVQVHIERIYDLLAERVSEHGHEVITPLSLREDRDGVFIQGAASLEAASADALSLLKAASKRLAFAATKMNATSSRSHAVCSLTVTKHRMATPSPPIVQPRRWSTKPSQRRRLDGTRRAILRRAIRPLTAHRHLSLPQTVPRPPTHEHPTPRRHAAGRSRHKARLARHHRRARRAPPRPSLDEVLGTDGHGRSA